jgi:hypothetical protein
MPDNQKVLPKPPALPSGRKRAPYHQWLIGEKRTIHVPTILSGIVLNAAKDLDAFVATILKEKEQAILDRDRLREELARREWQLEQIKDLLVRETPPSKASLQTMSADRAEKLLALYQILLQSSGHNAPPPL